MNEKKLNKRQELILALLEDEKKYTLGEIRALFTESDKVSLATLRRDISGLRNLGYLEHLGEFKSSRYSLKPYGILNAPIDPHKYCTLDVDKRGGKTGFNFSLFQSINFPLFTEEDFKKMDRATEEFKEKSKDASDMTIQKELERFVIELSWKSSKIEGNTYTLLDTEKLIKDGIEAIGHTKEEAIMILNHKKAFQYVLEFSKQGKEVSIRLIEDIHRILIQDLGVSFGLRKTQVGITGSSYRPLSVPSQIKEALEDLCFIIKKTNRSYEKAFIALIGLSYIQPFEDGNKRTARLLSNLILLNYDCAPLSYRSVDEILYKESTLVFYEKNSIVPMRDIFKKQYLFACEQYLKF